MRIKRILVVLMAFVALGASAQVDRPKLVVGLVVDQMRWDYLYTYQWGEGGFKTLMQDGYLCNNTIIDYVPTVTGAGHASILQARRPHSTASSATISHLTAKTFRVSRMTTSEPSEATKNPAVSLRATSSPPTLPTSFIWQPTTRAAPWA